MPRARRIAVLVVIVGQIDIADGPGVGGAVADRQRPEGPARPGRAEGWRPGQAQGQAGQLIGTVAPPLDDQGCVPIALSGRDHEPRIDLGVGELWQPRFPTAELVHAAADLLPTIREQTGRDVEMAEGPRWEIVVSPGVIRIRTRDYARAERAHERAVRRHQADVDMAVTYLREGDDVPEPLPTRGTIYAWSPRSRARMVARLSDLDYTALYGRYRSCDALRPRLCRPARRLPRLRLAYIDARRPLAPPPAMLTLTYPGDWLTVAPHGETVKRHFAALAKRYERAWTEPLVCIWKLEFQDRGAPHFHLSTTPPMGFTTIADPETGVLRSADFRTWLSITWADIVAHPDPEQRRRHRAAGTGVDYAEGIKLTDPRRMAVYFAKYSTGGRKDYQHCVPPEWLSACWSVTGAVRSTTRTATTARTAAASTRSSSRPALGQGGSGATAAYKPSSLPAGSPRRSASRPGG